MLADPVFAGAVERYGRFVEVRESMIREAIDAGEFIDVDPAFAQKAIVWMIRGTIADAEEQAPAQARDTADRLASFAVRALLKDPDELDQIREAAGVLLTPLPRLSRLSVVDGTDTLPINR